MATELKEGQNVRVVDREATANDEKSGLFYNYFRNLSGILEKLYDDGKACMLVDPTSLPEEIRQRHIDLTEVAKQKWLDGLSNEARNRLTADEQVFEMRYTILLEQKDLVKGSGKAVAIPGAKAVKSAAKAAAGSADDQKVLSAEDLDKIEEEHFKERQAQKEQ